MTTRFYTTERLGARRHLTPEGFLVVEAVALARTGDMVYGPEELPNVKPNGDGVIRVHRTPEEVFRPKTIASANGKSVCNDHPEEDVIPANFKEYEVGVIINPRRGDGADDDVMLGDLVIKDQTAIDAVKAGKRDLSLGYDADYVDNGDGTAEQKNILVNHVALVDVGRCGPRCSIGDQFRGKETMAKKRSWLDNLRHALKAKDEAKVEELMEEAPEEVRDAEIPDAGSTAAPNGDVHVHLNGAEGTEDHKFRDEFEAHKAQNETEHKEFRDRLDAIEGKMKDAAGEEEGDKEIEGELEEEAPPGTGDKARKARDSAYLGDSLQNTAALAEILAPGIRIPTFDKAADPKRTLDAIFALRKNALDVAYNTAVGRGIIDDANGNKPFDSSKLTRDNARVLFRAAAAAMRVHNNTRDARDNNTRQTTENAGIQSNAAFNKAARARWGQK